MEHSIVCLQFEQLQDPHADLSQQLAAAYGPDGLGVLVVAGVPQFERLRRELLALAPKLAVSAWLPARMPR
jgi:hypothetical protein